jgi:hypothetical protein
MYHFSIIEKKRKKKSLSAIFSFFYSFVIERYLTKERNGRICDFFLQHFFQL